MRPGLIDFQCDGDQKHQDRGEREQQTTIETSTLRHLERKSEDLTVL